jgi:hypothetical protein
VVLEDVLDSRDHILGLALGKRHWLCGAAEHGTIAFEFRYALELRSVDGLGS